ncbi:MAG: YIP1 family protein [Candidatus Binatus sp.]
MEPTGWTDSPYVGICIRPRATIRAIVDRDPTDRVITLVLIAAAIGALTNAIHSYNYNPTAFTIAGKPIPVMAPHTSQLMSFWGLAVWPLLAVPFLYINGALLRWSGSLLGGTAKAVEVRAAIAWPSVLTIVIALASFVVGFLAPPPSQPPASPSMNAALQYWRSILPYLIISAPLWLWWWIVSLKCLGEVHRFSAWRALGTTLIGFLLLGGVLVVVFIVMGTVQAVALELTDDPLVRALWLSLAAVVLIVLLAGGLFWKYSRSSAQS